MAPKDINTMAPNLKRDITTGPSPLLYYYRVCQLKIEDTATFSKKPSNVMHFLDGSKLVIFLDKYYYQTFSIKPFVFVQKLCGL